MGWASWREDNGGVAGEWEVVVIGCVGLRGIEGIVGIVSCPRLVSEMVGSKW